MTATVIPWTESFNGWYCVQTARMPALSRNLSLRWCKEELKYKNSHLLSLQKAVQNLIFGTLDFIFDCSCDRNFRQYLWNDGFFRHKCDSVDDYKHRTYTVFSAFCAVFYKIQKIRSRRSKKRKYSNIKKTAEKTNEQKRCSFIE